MNDQNHVWIIKRRTTDGSIPMWSERFRVDARLIVDYMNGFSKGKPDARYFVKKYEEVK